MTNFALKLWSWANCFITAESYLNCSQRLTNRVLNLSFKEKHSPIHKIKVQYLKEDGSVFTKTFKDKIIKLKL